MTLRAQSKIQQMWPKAQQIQQKMALKVCLKMK